MSTLAELVYLPRPRDVRTSPGGFTPGPGTGIRLTGGAQPLLSSALRLQAAGLESRRTPWGITAGAGRGQSLVLSTGGASLPAQGYKLTIDAHGVTVDGADPAGLSYGVSTLIQIIRQCSGPLPVGEIQDAPDFPVRGVMIDVSRDKVPTLATLFSIVDLLADMKINHLELYTEHTFAYSGHREVWADASPLTGEDILLLDRYCRERFVDLVPNQNSFGHMARWLTLPRYAALAECPDGFSFPWGGRHDGPFSLDPSNPGSIALLEELYAELLPHFTSRLFNVGCDETWDLGQGKNRELCQRRGKGRVYLDFLLQIHRRVSAHQRTMLYWGDIIVQYPELVAELPRDAVALEWGYEHNHPFQEHGAIFAKSGVPWWVCPGTSSWNSVGGRTANALGNIREAAGAGVAHGAGGFLNTDWGDNGHWQQLPVSWLGFSAGAALSWCSRASKGSDFISELDVNVFRDRARGVGTAVTRLGDASAAAGDPIHNASPLFEILQTPRGGKLPGGVSRKSLAAARGLVDEARARISAAVMERADAALVARELMATAGLLRFACDRGAAMLDGTLDTFTESPATREEIRSFIGEHRVLWMERNRVGGLADSVRRFASLLPAGLQV